MQKTLTLWETEYTVATMETGEAKCLRGKFSDPADFTIAIVAAALRAGGNPDANEDFVNKLPYFPVFIPLSIAAKEVNGLVDRKGEVQAAPTTAAA